MVDCCGLLLVGCVFVCLFVCVGLLCLWCLVFFCVCVAVVWVVVVVFRCLCCGLWLLMFGVSFRLLALGGPCLAVGGCVCFAFVCIGVLVVVDN